VSAAYLMNETKPSRVSFGVKTVNMNFEVDNPTGRLPVSGTNAKIEVGLKKFNNESIPMGNWTERPDYEGYNPFDSSAGNGDVSATWEVGTAIADSTAFIANEGEIFNVSLDFALVGATAQLRLVNYEGATKKGWSTIQTLTNGTHSFNYTVSPANDSTIIGTGNYAVFQIWNSSISEWELTNLNVVRTTTKPSEVFACSGVMQGRNIASAAGDYIKQTINIIQGKSDVVDIKVSYLLNQDNEVIPIGGAHLIH